VTTSARPAVDQAFLRRMAATTAQAAVDRTPVPTLRPASVVSSLDGVVTLVLDGDDGPVLAEALVPEPEPDDRVMVLLQPPSGAFVVGYVGASRDRWGSGGGGATEVVVDPAQPADRAELLLWVDTDATATAATWHPLTLIPPFTPYSGWGAPAIRQLGDVVELRGLVASGGAVAPANIAQVPACAGGNLIFLGAGDPPAGHGSADLRVQGTVLLLQTPIMSFVSLSMVRYSVVA
jgi:hypothetical protein